jgi:hypothetical protein
VKADESLALPEREQQPPRKKKPMKTHYTSKTLLAGAAMAGLLGGSALRLQAATPDSGSSSISKASLGQLADDAAPAKHGCKGQNSCKGQGGCKASDNGCKGKNSCKGKGGCATDGSKPA